MISGPGSAAGFFRESDLAVPESADVDQVVRLRQFTARHPEVNFQCRRDTWVWEATYPDSQQGCHTVYAPGLKELLDMVEQIFH